MLTVDQLRFTYPGAAQAALDGVSLEAKRGRVLGLLGPNGAGKTTLISHLAGLMPVQSGGIAIEGVPLAEARRVNPVRIAVAPQEYAFYPMLTVSENLACFAAAGRLSGARRNDRIDRCIAFAQLERFAGTRAERLSGGLKRRLNLAIALLPEPELLLFDEPTVGVDPQSRAFLLDAIRSLANDGAAVIYTSHYMEEIEAIADHVVIIDQGRVLRDAPLETLLSDAPLVVSVRSETPAPAALAGFGEIESDGRRLRVRLAPGQSPVAALAALEEAGIPVDQAEVGRNNLEQLFMALTKRSLRDD
jgi:ABC-2 type transport system ATP-binding protein